MKIPRILLAAGSSGSGKTLITCGLLEALVERGLKTASFKCAGLHRSDVPQLGDRDKVPESGHLFYRIRGNEISSDPKCQRL